ncbi:glutamine synthetase/guanido kinase [Hypoxylon sp. NC1633]|nr:glutamine synthetase/guanido kinase [Hypoxylon sp. NC1633]
MASFINNYRLLAAAIDNTPLIDNHAHPLLQAENINQHPLLSIASEANGDALQDSETSLAHIRAVKQLSKILGCEQTWDAVVTGIVHQRHQSLDRWTKKCLEGIETILIDDGLQLHGRARPYSWHSNFTTSKCKRIVRIETVASDILASFTATAEHPVTVDDNDVQHIIVEFCRRIEKYIADPEVVGFKSIICYRNGLHIESVDDLRKDGKSLKGGLEDIVNGGLKDESPISAASLKVRLENSPWNSLIVHKTAELISKTCGHKKPFQFHTGLGDNDITLTKSSPSHLQDFIRQYPAVPVVLLHAGYPWTRETAYLATMYTNVYADIGEVFPYISRQGQEGVLKQMLELCPYSKILCSTDGHGVPEMYLIATTQIRSVLKTVLGELVQTQQLTEKQAAELVQAILFFNSRKLYNLWTETDLPSLEELESVAITSSAQLRSLSPANWSNHEISNHEIVQKLQKFNTKYMRIYWHDYTSSAKCRLVPVRQIYKALESSKPFTLSLVKASLGLLQVDMMIPQVTGTGMYTYQPEWSTLKPGPIEGHVSCFGYFTEADGSEVALCPRTILRKTVEKAATEQGLAFLFGFEVEFIVMERNPDTTSPDKYRTLNNDGHAWSMARMLADWGRNGSFSTAIDDILDALDAAGILYEQFHPESAPGQYELVLPALPPMEACDSLLHARQILESVAARHGFRVTLHPKPFAQVCGSASHAHMSISSPGGDDPALYESFYAGILSHFRAIIAFTYSNPTSYERMVDSFWAGGRWITWGTQNKESPLRKIEGSHWELKVLDGLANPYFAVAALLAAGTDGIRKKTPLTWKDCEGDPALYTTEERSKLGIERMFPANLREALQALKDDESLGLDPAFVQRYVDSKEAEMKMLLDPLSPEERRRWVLERY